mmetsp:Transcript_92042/g.204267  ORF Transcript_92042/g.204267 Transcript_92042/m.204267 type:complete len:261 (+) Transcript_92042:396-1178(+)
MSADADWTILAEGTTTRGPSASLAIGAAYVTAGRSTSITSVDNSWVWLSMASQMRRLSCERSSISFRTKLSKTFIVRCRESTRSANSSLSRPPSTFHCAMTSSRDLCDDLSWLSASWKAVSCCSRWARSWRTISWRSFRPACWDVSWCSLAWASIWRRPRISARSSPSLCSSTSRRLCRPLGCACCFSQDKRRLWMSASLHLEFSAVSPDSLSSESRRSAMPARCVSRAWSSLARRLWAARCASESRACLSAESRRSLST